MVVRTSLFSALLATVVVALPLAAQARIPARVWREAPARYERDNRDGDSDSDRDSDSDSDSDRRRDRWDARYDPRDRRDERSGPRDVWHDGAWDRRAPRSPRRGGYDPRWERDGGWWWDLGLGRRIDADLARRHDAWHRRYGAASGDVRWIGAHDALHRQIRVEMRRRGFAVRRPPSATARLRGLIGGR